MLTDDGMMRRWRDELKLLFSGGVFGRDLREELLVYLLLSVLTRALPVSPRPPYRLLFPASLVSTFKLIFPTSLRQAALSSLHPTDCSFLVLSLHQAVTPSLPPSDCCYLPPAYRQGNTPSLPTFCRLTLHYLPASSSLTLHIFLPLPAWHFFSPSGWYSFPPSPSFRLHLLHSFPHTLDVCLTWSVSVQCNVVLTWGRITNS